ncbi:hypothetical protein METBIDRAFT_33100 [Metschnikowia bicuspidata var. bicuspidata NRRL YB-4993]|uniref:Programmed cell death protein 2 C-terminal domain-containing protein n=1 Tax=Metschnikowia bicuspidata var. bicuspidata NRRL YB-4993 TaxID=869754 RepID=A0A1A0H7T9_9ASCO|nr:hypothetical protein METBIDRAFT_33100 [Metschnikowia bicuspidata var. bicuspidata NRRL YB-4993]OBA20164.1 hypothetical protein METBIDRAFT_33100 [Metschnikowia bicuspidata var. bicuspidata NRRL YB-4993]
MSSHDEYSSDEEDLFDENSEVTLGFTDVAFDEEDEEPTIEDTFIGGQPIWLHPNSRPQPQDLQCGNCQKDMALLLQAFAPFHGQPYDRVIYVFACKSSRQCSGKKGSVKAIRGVCKDPSKIAEIEEAQARKAQELLDAKLRLDEKKKLHIELTKDLFDATKPSGEAKNPFGDNPFGGNPFGSSEKNSFGGNTPNPFDKHTGDEPDSAKNKLDSQNPTYALVSKTVGTEKLPTTTKPPQMALPEYPGYFIFTEPEKLKKMTVEVELEKYKDLIDKTEPSDVKNERSMSSSSATSSAALNPENSKIASMLNDEHFEKFSSTVGHNPSQVLRYSLGGRPLLYSGKDDVSKAFSSSTIPDPAYNPSSSRQFELQLMPKAIIDLEKNNSDLVADILSGMSWGTIIVATDTADFMPSLDENHIGYVVEYCGVQWEESI